MLPALSVVRYPALLYADNHARYGGLAERADAPTGSITPSVVDDDDSSNPTRVQTVVTAVVIDVVADESGVRSAIHRKPGVPNAVEVSGVKSYAE